MWRRHLTPSLAALAAQAEAQRELSVEHHSHRQGLASRLPEAYTTWGNQPTSGSVLQAEAFVARGIVHQA